MLTVLIINDYNTTLIQINLIFIDFTICNSSHHKRIFVINLSDKHLIFQSYITTKLLVNNFVYSTQSTALTNLIFEYNKFSYFERFFAAI